MIVYSWCAGRAIIISLLPGILNTPNRKLGQTLHVNFIYPFFIAKVGSMSMSMMSTQQNCSSTLEIKGYI